MSISKVTGQTNSRRKIQRKGRRLLITQQIIRSKNLIEIYRLIDRNPRISRTTLAKRCV